MQHLAHSLLTGSHPEDAHGVEAVQLQVSANIQRLRRILYKSIFYILCMNLMQVVTMAGTQGWGLILSEGSPGSSNLTIVSA